MMQKWSLRSVWVSFSWERNREDSEQSRKFEGKKNWKSFKNCLRNSEHAFFATETSLQGKPPKHSKTKLRKNFLSVFHDWKVYPRGSRELSHENFCVPLAIGPFTYEQVAKINTRARGCSMRLGWPATESPKQGNIVFENFQFL